MIKCFLGGTCNNSTWRDELIPMLEIDYFNPVVKDWTPDCQAEELKQREECDYVLYVITPKMTGVYSIAEVTDDSNKRPSQTIFCYLVDDDVKSFDKFQQKSLNAVGDLVLDNGATWLTSLQDIADYLNSRG